jgi:hypothetical protein
VSSLVVIEAGGLGKAVDGCDPGSRAFPFPVVQAALSSLIFKNNSYITGKAASAGCLR